MSVNGSLEADKIKTKKFNSSLPLFADDNIIIGPKKRSKFRIVVEPLKSK